MASIAQGLVIGDLLLFSLLRVARENAIEHVVPATDSDLLPAALLTRIAVQTSFLDLLPVVSYVTRLNVFVLTSTALFFLVLAASPRTSSLVQKIDVERAARFDR